MAMPRCLRPRLTAMSTTVADHLAAVERLWPVSGAASWDAVGLVAGDPAHEVARVLLAVDPVSATVDEAVSGGFDLLLAHHPMLLRGVTSVATDRYKGALLSRLITAECALIAAHTNADVVDTGTSAVLAAALGLTGLAPIESAPGGGIGRVGTLAEPTTLGRFARRVADVLPATAGGVLVSGDYEAEVRTVAVCGGAGDAFLAHPLVRSADAYVTADLRHHPASEAREQGAARRRPGPRLGVALGERVALARHRGRGAARAPA